jgi:N6-adenosine-specific RNA methylase IME4
VSGPPAGLDESVSPWCQSSLRVDRLRQLSAEINISLADVGYPCYPGEPCFGLRRMRRSPPIIEVASELRTALAGREYGCILADPPWQFTNRTGKIAPEHRRLSRYLTLTLEAICALPVQEVAAPVSHLYLWVPNALLPEGLTVMRAWGFTYKSNLVWHKIRKDGRSDGRGVGFYFRNVTEMVLFGVRGKNARTLTPGRRQVNYLATRKREHSRKPDELYPIVEACSPGPRLELFARGTHPGWDTWGDEAQSYEPAWPTYRHNSATERRQQRLLLPLE